MSLTPPPSAPPASPDAPGDAPSRANPTTFRALADAFVAWQVTFRDSIASLRTWLADYITWAGTNVTELDALQADVTSKQTAAAGSATLAQDWASKTDGEVSGGEFSSKYHALAAATSATNAGTSETNAAASLADLKNRYMGAYASDPATRPDGSALTVGSAYFNSTTGLFMVWNGATFQASDINTANLAASSGSSLVGFVQSGTGAVARTVQDEFRDRVNVKQFGAKGDGVTDDTAAINNAVAAARAVRKTLIWTTGDYIYNGNLYCLPVDMKASGTVRIYLTGRFQFQTDANAIATTTLAADAAKDATSVQVSSAAGIVPGQLLVITDPTVMDTAFVRGSFVAAVVTAVAGTTVTLADPLVFPLFAGAAISVRPAETCLVEGIDFYMPANPGSNVYCLVFSGLINPRAKRCNFYEPTRQKAVLNNAIFAQQCYKPQFNDIDMDGPLYGISVPGSRFAEVKNMTMREGRHPVAPSYGASDVEVDGLVCHSCESSLDGHIGFNITYRNVRSYNEKAWFALRCLGVTLENVQIENQVAPAGTPQLHTNFLSPAFAALNQGFDLKVDGFHIVTPAAASLDIPYGRSVRLLNFEAPQLTVSISGGSALQVASAYIDESCVFAAQGGSRMYVRDMRGNDSVVHAGLNAGVYEIKSFNRFVKNAGNIAKFAGRVLAYSAQAASFTLPLKLFDSFGYAPNAYFRWVNGFVTITVSNQVGTRKRKFRFQHIIVGSSGITFDLVAVSNEATSASASVPDVAVANPTQSGATQVGADRTQHWIAFDANFTQDAARSVEVNYEVELFGVE